LKEVYDLGCKYERENTNCCQCVLAVVQKVFELKDGDVFKARTKRAE
jgi:hypothetical protein